MSEQPNDFRQAVLEAVKDEHAFLRMTLSSPSKGCPWEHVAVRPIRLKDQRCLQLAYTAGKTHITKNILPQDLDEALTALLAAGLGRIHVQCSTGDLHIRITRKGKALVTRGKASRGEDQPVLEHDHRKSYALSADKPDAFLQEIGLMTAEGKVKASAFGKFRQINEYLRVIQQVIDELGGPAPADGHALPQAARKSTEPLLLVDCGCGNAHLTFAAFHYLSHVRGLAVRAVGVDINESVMTNCGQLRDKLGWDGLDFVASTIAHYAPPSPPQVVVSLHACDTATDEALARGVAWGSQAILAAPCCQHELHDQIQSPAFRAALRHGLLRQRLADILTDSLRAAALRVMGYRTRVFEFISPEHTGKNLMISAQKVAMPQADRQAAAAEYLDLKRYWNVTPEIEQALGEPFQDALRAKQ